MSVTILPTFKGYTLDLRLQDVRKAIPGITLEFIPFLSPKGRKLFRELEALAPEVVDFYNYE